MGKTLVSASGARILVIGLVFLAITAPLRAAPVPVSHDLTVTLDPENQRLTGKDTLRLEARGAVDLLLSLAPDAHIVSVALAKEATPFAFDDGHLRILLPDKARHGEIEIAVSYEGFFRDTVPVNPVQTEDPGYGVTGIISSEGTFLLSGARWYPDLVGSRPTFRISVQAPAGWRAVTAGRRLSSETNGKTTTSVWETMHPLQGIALSAGPYVVREDAVGEIPIYTYFFPEDDPLAEGYLKATAGYLDLYTDLFGPYPFEKFAVVENFFPTGYGLPSYTLLGRTVVRLPFIVETSLGHEVAHGWWGNGVFVDYQRGNWSEGLTTYVADYLYKERSGPEEALTYRLRVLRDYATLVSPEKDFALRDFAGRFSPASRAVGYGKAAMVFHMARRMVGDGAFWAGLQRVAQKKLFKKASWDDFAVAFEQKSGLAFKPFFHQWVDRPGAPDLALESVDVEQDGEAWRISGRVTQKAPYYNLSILVRLETEGKNIDTTTSLTGPEAAFMLRAGTVPRRLLVDPDVDIFRRLYPSEIPPVTNGIKGSESLVIVVARGVPEDVREASKILMETLGQNRAPVLREDETSLSSLQDHDILYLGFPEGKTYLPPLPAGVSVSAHGFTIEGVTYVNAEDVLFIVLPHPEQAGRVAAVFLPLSAKAVAAAARKIPHYGKYSYLVFHDGVNQAKGTWPVSASPLVHVFPVREAFK